MPPPDSPPMPPQRPPHEMLYQPQLGCLLLTGVLLGMCILPQVVVGMLQTVLEKLHLYPMLAPLLLLGVLLGGLINIPLYRFPRDEEQFVPGSPFWGLVGWPQASRAGFESILAVNVGGCLFPLAIMMYELTIMLQAPPPARWALLAAVLVNIAVCYFVAKPIAGLGIALPAFTSPAVAVAITWLLLWHDDYALIRAPVAFIAGVCGPLIGADLLHLRDIRKISAGLVSIGGAGTFDGIVISGMLAALVV